MLKHADGRRAALGSGPVLTLVLLDAGDTWACSQNGPQTWGVPFGVLSKLRPVQGQQPTWATCSTRFPAMETGKLNLLN